MGEEAEQPGGSRVTSRTEARLINDTFKKKTSPNIYEQSTAPATAASRSIYGDAATWHHWSYLSAPGAA